MRYKCIKALWIPNKCDDGFITEQELIVEKGTVWELDNPDQNFTGGEIRLVNVNPTSGGRIEISKKTLDVYFEEVLGDGKTPPDYDL